MVPRYELGDADPIAGKHWLDCEISRCEVAEQPHFRAPAKTATEEICDFCDDELRHDKRAVVGLEERQAGFVIVVVLVNEGIERAGIDDENYCPNPSPRSSSMRRAVSW